MNWTELCNDCIWLMEIASNIFGVSYGFINILLFVILEPLSILMLFISTLLALFKKKKSSIIFGIFGVVPIIFIIVTLLITIWAAPAFIICS